MNWRRFCTVTLVIAGVWSGLLLFTPPKADAVSPNVPIRNPPVGWLACQSAHAEPYSWVGRECKERGWIVRPRVVLSPENRVAYMWLPLCKSEDDHGPCLWDAGTMGNKHGRSFVALNHAGRFYLSNWGGL